MAENSLFCTLIYKMNVNCMLLALLISWKLRTQTFFSQFLTCAKHMQSTTWKRFQNKRSSSSKKLLHLAENSLFWKFITRWRSTASQLHLWFLENWKHIPIHLFSILNLWHTYTESHPNSGAEGQNKRSSSSKRRFIQQKLASFEF